MHSLLEPPVPRNALAPVCSSPPLLLSPPPLRLVPAAVSPRKRAALVSDVAFLCSCPLISPTVRPTTQPLRVLGDDVGWVEVVVALLGVPPPGPTCNFSPVYTQQGPCPRKGLREALGAVVRSTTRKEKTKINVPCCKGKTDKSDYEQRQPRRSNTTKFKRRNDSFFTSFRKNC